MKGAYCLTSALPAVRLLDIDSLRWDGDLAKAYAVRRVPTLYLMANGTILPIPPCL